MALLAVVGGGRDRPPTDHETEALSGSRRIGRHIGDAIACGANGWPPLQAPRRQPWKPLRPRDIEAVHRPTISMPTTLVCPSSHPVILSMTR